MEKHLINFMGTGDDLQPTIITFDMGFIPTEIEKEELALCFDAQFGEEEDITLEELLQLTKEVGIPMSYERPTK